MSASRALCCATLVVALFLGVACAPPAIIDAGVGGKHVDAGALIDAGAVDAGSDAGPLVDAGADAGSPVDAGSDAGPEPTDAGAPDDAGLDAGDPGLDAGYDGGVLDDAGNEAGPVDLGWPFPDTLPAPCPAQVLDDGAGAAWDGWANYQHPPALTVATGSETPPLYGQVYRQGETEAAGQAPGWQAELLVGPFGSLPTGEGRCWQALPASFNVQANNNDEYSATVTPTTRGLHGLLFRYRPSGGRWRYGDLGTGSDDGLQAVAAGQLLVTGGSAPLRVVTMNLRCRVDGWTARRPLLVAALARVDPDLVAFQEDCLDPDTGRSQAEDLLEDLAARTRRGYLFRRQTTHVANHPEGSFEEGVSLLSAHPIEDEGVLTLPSAHLPRRALWIDVTLGGRALRFYATHFDFGQDAAAERTSSAQLILDSAPAARAVLVAGDLNTTPDSEAAQRLSSALVDLWGRANPSQPGLTFPASSPARRIDYVFASPPLALGLRGAKLLDEEAGGTRLSDHLGVAVSLE